MVSLEEVCCVITTQKTNTFIIKSIDGTQVTNWLLKKAQRQMKVKTDVWIFLMVDVNTKFNFFLNINNSSKSLSTGKDRCQVGAHCWYFYSFQIIKLFEFWADYSLDLDVGEGSWSKNELVKSSEKRSHEGVWFSDVNFSRVVQIELSPGSWEEFGHVGLHLSFGNLLGDQEDLGACLLASFLVEHFLSGGNTSSVGDWDGVVVEDVVHNIVFVGSVVSWCWSVSGSWGWIFLLLLSFEVDSWDLFNISCSEKSCNSDQSCIFHFNYQKLIIRNNLKA